MNIEFDNEMIETLIKDEVSRQVKEWFRNHNDYIRDTMEIFVQGMVNEQIKRCEIDIEATAKAMQTKKLAEEITDCIGYNIANYFMERYDL